MTGGPYTWSRSRNFYQEIEDFPLFKPVTKFSAQVTDASRLPDLLAQAFRAATVGKPRPVHLELAGHAGEVIEDQEFEAEVPETGVVKVPPMRVCAEPAAIETALGVLRAAKRPVIVAGGGVRTSGAGPEVIALAERLGIPIATSLNGKDSVLGEHPLNIGVVGRYSRASANQVILEADLVFYIGSQTGSQVTLNWQVPPTTTRVLQLDIDPAEPGRHYPHSVVLFCDAKAGIAQLLTALNEEDRPVPAEWTQRAQELVQQWRDHERPRIESDQVPIRPERLCSELSQYMPDDALLVSDTGHAGMWTGGYVDLKFPQQGYIRAAGSLGWGLPAALGAQLGQPDRPVILFTGDGGLWYHVAELETAGRWQIPLVIVVNNNRSLNQEIDPMKAAYGGTLHGRHSELWHFADLDLAAMADTMGVQGITVRKAGDFRGALEKALAVTGPALINVVTDVEALAPPGNAERADSDT